MSEKVATEITDAVTQSSVMNVGMAPAMSTGPMYQTMAHSTGLLFENAVKQQRLDGEVSMASTASAISQILQNNQQNTINEALKKFL